MRTIDAVYLAVLAWDERRTALRRELLVSFRPFLLARSASLLPGTSLLNDSMMLALGMEC